MQPHTGCRAPGANLLCTSRAVSSYSNVAADIRFEYLSLLLFRLASVMEYLSSVISIHHGSISLLFSLF